MLFDYDEETIRAATEEQDPAIPEAEEGTTSSQGRAESQDPPPRP